MSRIASVLFVLMLAVPASAEPATSIRDLVQLKAAGLSDEILIALIQSDGSVFSLSADDIIDVRRQGLSEPVILAMLATRKRPQPAVTITRDTYPPAASATAPTDTPVMQDDTTERTSQSETVTVPPVTVKVEQHVTQTQTVQAPEPQVQYVPVPVAYPVYPITPIVDRTPVKPLYWGFGGERRPDTWQPIGGLRGDTRAAEPSTPAKTPTPAATPRIKK